MQPRARLIPTLTQTHQQLCPLLCRTNMSITNIINHKTTKLISKGMSSSLCQQIHLIELSRFSTQPFDLIVQQVFNGKGDPIRHSCSSRQTYSRFRGTSGVSILVLTAYETCTDFIHQYVEYRASLVITLMEADRCHLRHMEALPLPLRTSGHMDSRSMSTRTTTLKLLLHQCHRRRIENAA
jgi:hypothetical protein